jgi:hypothetical protein
MSDIKDLQAGPPLSGVFQMGARPSQSPSTSERRATPPFSLRLTFEERARLEREAGEMPLGAYIRSRLFDEPASDRPLRQRKRPVKDHQVLGQLLGELGRSRIANNLNQLAKAANTGSLLLNEDVHRALLESLDSIRAMRTLLLTALGLKPETSLKDGG